jgi:hypothetical protein
MSSDTVTEQRPEVRKQEVVLYHIVGNDFRWDNIYAMGGKRPNAKSIARQYGAELEFRESTFREVGRERFFPSYLARHGIAEDHSCTSAVLVGEDREKLMKAMRDIHMTFGVANFEDGAIDVSDRKPFL